uniref:Ankyrin repeat domain-containing protein n=1 Tax=Laticauda laticaudata TaxID=8630 RepID=A0A8C5SPN7_LATLA
VVILLLKCGADPTLIDGEGYSSLHLAVLFQHMPIIAYLISKGQVCGFMREPTHFLVKFNPSVNAVDNIEKNTALHWAVIAGNVNAIDVLLDAGSSLDIKNVKVFYFHY